jgi:hypothetical protein
MRLPTLSPYSRSAAPNARELFTAAAPWALLAAIALFGLVAY